VGITVSDDRYTELVLEASIYEELRLRRGMATRLPIAAKIGGCSLLSFLAATLAPIVAVLPPAVRDRYFETAPTTAALSVTLLALFGCACLFVAAVGLAWIVHTRSPVDAVSEDAAWRLVGLENIFTGVAFLTGGLGIACAVGLAGTGLLGTGTVEQLLGAGVDPYQTGPAGARTPVETSVVATVGGVLTAALGLIVHRTAQTEETAGAKASR
jgi:hypothetical protein